MAVTLREREDEPAKAIGEAPLDTPDDQRIADLWAGIENARDIRATWARIEGWCSVRWTPRPVLWIVEGDGEWEPPLSPATFATVEIWRGAAWEAAPLAIGPMGGPWLDEWGTYRVTATVGAGPLPAAVIEAFWRLSLYLAERDGPAHPRGVAWNGAGGWLIFSRERQGEGRSAQGGKASGGRLEA